MIFTEQREAHVPSTVFYSDRTKRQIVMYKEKLTVCDGKISQPKLFNNEHMDTCLQWLDDDEAKLPVESHELRSWWHEFVPRIIR